MNQTVDISPGWSTVQDHGKPIEIKESVRPFKEAPDWANYYVRNCNGSVTYFEHQPEIEWQSYFCNTGRHLRVEAGLAYTPGWRRTIRKRPGS
jgi:hypothetical protein